MKNIFQQQSIKREYGMTMVEFMVALALMMIVTLAAVMSVTASSNAYTNLDQASQLRDNARYATDLVRRILVQAGYEHYDAVDAVLKREAMNEGGTLSSSVADTIDPDIRGYNNVIASTTPNSVLNDLAHNNRNSRCGSISDTSCVNGSDAIVVRFNGASTTANSTATMDGSVVNCMGASQYSASNVADRAVNVFHVKRDKTGEPSLYCTYRSNDPASSAMSTEVLISGVESLQFLYGVDSITPTVATPSTARAPQYPTRYLRADQIDVPGNEPASFENWRRVRTVLVGMVLRGALGSAPESSGNSITYYPFGSGIYSSSDAGTQFVAPADGRMRQVVTFTVHLRNDQTLR